MEEESSRDSSLCQRLSTLQQTHSLCASEAEYYYTEKELECIVGDRKLAVQQWRPNYEIAPWLLGYLRAPTWMQCALGVREHYCLGTNGDIQILEIHGTSLSLGLVLSGANFYILALTNLRLSGLGRDRKMMSLSCYIHMFCVKNVYAFCYIR